MQCITTLKYGSKNTMKKRLYGQDIMKGEWNPERERESNMSSAPGGSMMPSAKLGPDGKFLRQEIRMGVSPDEGTGVSIFDPVLCEAMYLWFSKEGQTILDPFAGGSVRGIVANKMGRQYVGVELRKEQVDANIIQGKLLCPENEPVWKCGNSQDIKEICNGLEADMIFSCPPYADLEVYSNDPRDISNMEYEKFRAAYSEIIEKTCSLLKPNRFAVFVVGEVRNKKKPGYYRNFVPHTIEAFEKAGLHFYNEAILITAIGSLSIRCARPFNAARKMGKTHQNILVFVKGDPNIAAQELGEVQMDESLFTKLEESKDENFGEEL